jgi:hypothetical protein
MSLDIDEVNSVNDYNDFLETPQYPSTPKLAIQLDAGAITGDTLTIEEYEQCENCGRKFFQGKLIYHEKICTKLKPMLRSPAKS